MSCGVRRLRALDDQLAAAAQKAKEPPAPERRSVAFEREHPSAGARLESAVESTPAAVESAASGWPPGRKAAVAGGE